MRTPDRYQTVWPSILAAIALTLLLPGAPVLAQDPGLAYPNTAEVSDQKTGSLLFFNYYTSSTAPPAMQETEISITNTHPTTGVTLRLFFVANNGMVARAFTSVARLQTLSFFMSDVDPSVTGYFVAMAVNDVTGCPINFNFLMGDAHIKLSSGHMVSLGAIAVAAIAATPASCLGATTLLNFDNVNYNRLPRVVVAESIVSRADGNDTLLVLNRVGGNLAPGGSAASIGTLTGLLIDDAVSGFPFSQGSLGPQLFSALTDGFPVTTPPFQTAIPSGRTGWMKLFGATDIALLGAVFNTNPSVGTSAGAFNHGHNLTHQTLTATATLTVPIGIPDLTISKTHSGSFTIGGTGSYTITATNVGNGVVSGLTRVTDGLPGNLTLAGFSGAGWTCTGVGTASVNCQNSTAVSPAASYPPLTLNVNVGPGTPVGVNSITNIAEVFTFDEVNSANNTASDPTTVNSPNPVPVLTSLSPNSAFAGGSAFTLTVNGSGFVANSSIVRWNGINRTTTFIDTTRLTAQIPASDIAIGGTASVTVFNPAPGGGVSNTLTLTINNPVPALTSLSPNSAFAGGSAFTLTLNGSGFVANSSLVRWNGINRTTTFIDTTRLTAQIPASDIASAGTASVTVFNPLPGGGVSNALSFTITGAGLMFYPLAQPIRLLDTRPSESACFNPGVPLGNDAVRTQPAVGACSGIPASAKAIVGNATVVNFISTGSHWITLYPSDAAQPNASNLNFSDGQIVPNNFTVGLGPDGAFKIYSHASTHFIVDITGYYAPPGTGGLYYHPLPAPVRLFDSRPSESACDAPGVPLADNGTRAVTAHGTCFSATIPSTAKAIVGNATVVNFISSGFHWITLYPFGATLPNASNLNFSASQIVPNWFVVGLSSDGKFNIYSHASTHFIVDVAGYFSDEPMDVNGQGLLYNALPTPVRLLDTRPSEVGCDAPGAPLGNDATRTQTAHRTCFSVTIPSTAKAVVGNATVVNFISTGFHWITLYPFGISQPNASNLNFTASQIVPNAFWVGLSSDGKFNIYSHASTHFIVDLSGYFAP